jgi:hypothetical protein
MTNGRAMASTLFTAGTWPGGLSDLLYSRLTRTGAEYEGTFLVGSWVDLAMQLAK